MAPSLQEYVSRPAAPGRLIGGRRCASSSEPAPEATATVVTVTFNSARTLDRTIDSVLAQTYPHTEYIIVDGGSEDGTVQKLTARSSQVDLWISEPDRGISDAFNKGIALARGEYISLVNSDDWLEPQHLSNAIGDLRASGADFVFGDVMFHSPEGRPLYSIRGEPRYGEHLGRRMPHINHPTVVCRRSAYETYGVFDTRFSVAMDYEWLLRGHLAGMRGTYDPRLNVHMTLEGKSDRSYRKALREVRDISVLYGYPKALAHVLWLTRMAKIASRRAMRDVIPAPLYEKLRRRMNPNYRSIGDGGPL
jgi:glycosyltransferase involved in cell wall biosynthesis